MENMVLFAAGTSSPSEQHIHKVKKNNPNTPIRAATNDFFFPIIE